MLYVYFIFSKKLISFSKIEKFDLLLYDVNFLGAAITLLTYREAIVNFSGPELEVENIETDYSAQNLYFSIVISLQPDVAYI